MLNLLTRSISPMQPGFAGVNQPLHSFVVQAPTKAQGRGCQGISACYHHEHWLSSSRDIDLLLIALQLRISLILMGISSMRRQAMSFVSLTAQRRVEPHRTVLSSASIDRAISDTR